MSAFTELPPYPPSPRGETVEEFHGKRLPDPYRWLEDLDSPQVARWIQA